MGRVGYCSLASPSSMMESPMAISACMIEPSGRGTRMRSVPSNAETRKSINLGAPLTRKYGTILLTPGRRQRAVLGDSGVGAAASFMDDLHCNLDFRAALKVGRGKLRRAR